MPIRRKKIDTRTDRTAGEEFNLSGSGLAAGGSVPRDAEIAFDRQDADRIPLSVIRGLKVETSFHTVWLFHAPVATTAPSQMEMLAFTDDARPTQVPQPLAAQMYRRRVTAASIPGGVLEEMFTPEFYGSPGVSVAGATRIANNNANERFRMMGFSLHLTGNATLAVAGELAVAIRCGGVDMFYFTFYVPAVAANVFAGFSTPWYDLKNGLMGAFPGEHLGDPWDLWLSVALVTGSVRLQFQGTKEVP